MRKFIKILIIFIFAICLCGVVTKVKADAAEKIIFEKIQQMGIEALNFNSLKKNALSFDSQEYRHGQLLMGFHNIQCSDFSDAPNYYQDLYCIQYDRYLLKDNQFKVAKYVEISGNSAQAAVSTNENVTPNLSEPVGNPKNGTLAYLIAAKNDKLKPRDEWLQLDGSYLSIYKDENNKKFGRYSFRQQLIYSYINDWLIEVGGYFFGSDFVDNNKEYFERNKEFGKTRN